jgi:plasmid maintenance system antidote protein VapI
VSKRPLPSDQSTPDQPAAAVSYDSPARAALAGQVKPLGPLKQTKLAKMLGCHQSHVSRLVSGDADPTILEAAALEALFGIPSSDWLTTKEREALARLPSAPTASAA